MYKLREIERGDIPTINTWRSSSELINHLGAPFRYINEDVEFKWYDNYMNNRGTNIRCAILNEKDQVIGLASLTNIDRMNQSAVFHIMIGDNSYREKGAGSFATNYILKHAFLDMNLNRIELSVLKSNKKALALYDKVGFKEEGIKREVIFKNGKFINMIIMSILKSEFKDRVIV